MNHSTAVEQTPALLTDLYQLTMLQSYWKEGMAQSAIYDFGMRSLPGCRNYLVMAGLESVLELLESLHFTAQDLAYLSTLGLFGDDFLSWLQDFRFTGTVHALAEGTLFFPPAPMLLIEAPLPQAQLVETAVMNQLHFQTLVASKAARVTQACQGKPFMEFALRRTHGMDAGLKASRSAYLAGASLTSNVEAGRRWQIPVSGTMAHAFVQAHGDELSAFRAYAALYPEGALLVDTYDTLQGVRHVIALAKELGTAFRIRAIRLDSGDLVALAKSARQMLDEAGLLQMKIYVSGGLDEHSVAQLEASGAPIDAYAVGTSLWVSEDLPATSCVYKCAVYGGRPVMKKATGKRSLPGFKQLYRHQQDGRFSHDCIELRDAQASGTPLLQRVMVDGKRVNRPANPLAEARERCAEQLRQLPDELLGLTQASTPYPVQIGPHLTTLIEQLCG
ncbi:putative nicotinate phosphoribosyltransferase [Magnetococcus marinus MC-1]|uniref:Nicotinate phosphoribosyltransferase n=1 Tax=Magnetococcus marinus (strain ATCC BAA-1437 / JCM 17883 / MC-1) TaxID=156889 RepID=A0L6Y0_MAGMM|nr:nicotinate phosphoribosyltransferase [Magnetococcus marinus]ABK43723.1 putative nicotinate phosphoribosyltransferase [Magnetococcus marinus MC-1]